MYQEYMFDLETSTRVTNASGRSPFVTILVIIAALLGLLTLAWAGYKAFKKLPTRSSDTPLQNIPTVAREPMQFVLARRAAQETCELSFEFTASCILQTNFPLPDNDFYFELMLLALPPGSGLKVGLSSFRSSSETTAFGQGSAMLDVGRRRLFRHGADYGPALAVGEGDIVGCSVKTSSLSVTFLCNGMAGSPIPFSASTPLFPTIWGTRDCRVKYNFGSDDFIYGPDSLPPAPPLELLPKYEDIARQLPEYE